MSPALDAAPAIPTETHIQVLRTPDCPNVAATLSLLSSCLAELRRKIPIRVHEGDYPSPTILVSGVDVMGRTSLQGAMCRLDLPTRDHVLAALVR